MQYFLRSKTPCSDKSGDDCFIAAVSLPAKTSRAVIRARKLETRKNKSKIKCLLLHKFSVESG